MTLALAMALMLSAADGGAPDAGEPLGLVLSVPSVDVPLSDGGVLIIAPALVLDETAALRVARELARARAEIPALRANPPPLPGWAVGLLLLGFAAGSGVATAAGLALASEGRP